MALICEGGVPDSMTEDTKAAKVGAAAPGISNRSGWMKLSPSKPWPARVTGP